MRSFFKKHKALCILFSVLLLAVCFTVLLIIREMQALQLNPGELAGFLSGETTADTVSEAEKTGSETGSETGTETTEAVTEAPKPYYSPETDAAYIPPVHTSHEQSCPLSADETHRVYSILPHTDSEPFNEYVRKTATSLATAATGEHTYREGGTTVVSIDYILHTADKIYSAVILRTVTDTVAETVDKHVVVRIYNTETGDVFAPLDVYDMTIAGVPLSAQMRTGFADALAAAGFAEDSAFLDRECTPEPSSFVNIAVDPEFLYFYRIYKPSDSEPVLLCAPVAFAALEDYTWEAIEIAKRVEALTPPKEELIPVDLPTYDISGAVPESEMVEEDYFDDALFIGNSLIVGLQRTVPLKARYFATIGLNVSQVFTKEVIGLTDGTNTTISHAIELVDFNKVYLMFGVNELGWGSITSFIDYYAQIIDRIREVNPDALIYVQSILPVNEEKWAKSRDYQSCINNVAVATFNQKIVEMCNDKYVYFVNVAEALSDDDGALYADATSDGIHISAAYSTRWVEYLKTHTVPMEPKED